MLSSSIGGRRMDLVPLTENLSVLSSKLNAEMMLRAFANYLHPIDSFFTQEILYLKTIIPTNLSYMEMPTLSSYNNTVDMTFDLPPPPPP